MNAIPWMIAGVVMFLVVIGWSLCAIAGRSDDQADRLEDKMNAERKRE